MATSSLIESAKLALSYRRAYCDSEHFPFIVNITVHISVKKDRNQGEITEKFNIEKLKEDTEVGRYQIEINNRFEPANKYKMIAKPQNIWKRREGHQGREI